MPEINVSDFSYIVTSNPQLKKGRTQKLKGRGEYQHYRDFYVSLRPALKGLVKNKKSFIELQAIVDRVSEKKRPHYKSLIDKFIGWIQGKSVQQFDSPKGVYTYASTRIICNPELNYIVENNAKLIKLHLNGSQSMTVKRANYICYIMSESCGFPLEQCVVLDLHQKREFKFQGGDDFEDELYREILLFESNFMAD
ncbi:hypothetical protein [Salinicola salarius]|uniref:hypothetical protein n=1 Tax=Salinicola salarius TaxID=430457 RepID=UPI000DA1CEC0|nr:hypothetical protein [Salinicola salarius]